MSDAKPALLLIHGFGGGRAELAPLQRRLRNDGYFCYSLALPGHDSNGHISSGFRHTHFLRAARHAYARLHKQHDKIAIIGFSMGGLLAIHLAAEFSPSSIVLINVPILTWNAGAIAHWLHDDLIHKCLFHTRRLISSAVRQSLLTNLEYPRLLLKTIPIMKAVTCPCLILQSNRDDTAHFCSAAIIEQLLTSAVCRRQYYHRSWHTICLSPDAGLLYRDISHFLSA